jgi:hypothetical protein
MQIPYPALSLNLLYNKPPHDIVYTVHHYDSIVLI